MKHNTLNLEARLVVTKKLIQMRRENTGFVKHASIAFCVSEDLVLCVVSKIEPTKWISSRNIFRVRQWQAHGVRLLEHGNDASS